MSYYGPERSGDGWGQADRSYANVDLGYPAGYQNPPPRNAGGSRVLLAVLVTIMVLVLCGGGVGALYLIGAGSKPSTGSSPPASTASQSATFDPTTVVQGQCLSIDGPGDAPKIHPAGCDPGNYQVVKRIDGTSDDNSCKGVANAKYVYHYATTPADHSFVLCLHQF